MQGRVSWEPLPQNQDDQRLATSTELPVFRFPPLLISASGFSVLSKHWFGPLSILPGSYQDCQPRLGVPRLSWDGARALHIPHVPQTTCSGLP